MLASPPPIACKHWLAVRISRRIGTHHRWTTLVWQANRSGRQRRAHPYQQSSAYRYATRRFRRWRATVKGQVMRSNVPTQPAHGQDAAAAGRVGDQLVAGKGIGLPGGRGSPIKRRDRG
jgi:hypothetical protein